jgi:hypothetical protein
MPAGGCHRQRRRASARPPRESQRSASHVLGARRPPSTAHRTFAVRPAGAYAQATTPSGDPAGLLAHRYLHATHQSFGVTADGAAVSFVLFGFSISSDGPAVRHARTPRTPTVVPIARDAAISTAWTQRNDVGIPFENDRSSAQIAKANRGQISHVQTPTAIRNAAQRRDTTTAQVCAHPSAILELWLPLCRLRSDLVQPQLQDRGGQKGVSSEGAGRGSRCSGRPERSCPPPTGPRPGRAGWSPPRRRRTAAVG